MSNSLLQRRRDTVIFEDTAIIYRNFAGEKRRYNLEGDRNFSIMMGELQALDLEASGWNVKPMKRREEDEDQLYHLKVKVNFDNRPPRVYLVSNLDPETGLGRNKTLLTPSLIGMLDKLEYVLVDLTIVAFDWKNAEGNTGRTAYLQSLFFTMYEDDLEKKYADLEQQLGGVDVDATQKQLEVGSRLPYDYDAVVVDENGDAPEWAVR